MKNLLKRLFFIDDNKISGYLKIFIFAVLFGIVLGVVKYLL